jgi:hypothetical protein
MKALVIILGLAAAIGSLQWSAAEAMPRGFQEHRFNGRAPIHADGVTTFHVRAGDCSAIDYGDGRGESDCFNGNLRSRIAYRTYARLGDSVQYRMEIFIPADLRYGGGPNRRSLLEIAEWQRINTIKNHIHQLHVDSSKGVTFDDVRCFAPSEFGQWNTFTLQVRWSMQDDGILRVLCNDRVVVNRRGRTAIPPDCGQPGVFQCVPELQRPDEPIQFQAGILFRGFGEQNRRDGLSPRGRMSPDQGFTIRMRNIEVSNVRFR